MKSIFLIFIKYNNYFQYTGTTAAKPENEYGVCECKWE